MARRLYIYNMPPRPRIGLEETAVKARDYMRRKNLTYTPFGQISLAQAKILGLMYDQITEIGARPRPRQSVDKLRVQQRTIMPLWERNFIRTYGDEGDMVSITPLGELAYEYWWWKNLPLESQPLERARYR